MAVIGTYSSTFAKLAAENAIATRQEKRVMRDSDAERLITDIQKRMMMEGIASSQKQTELTVSIAQKGGSAIQSGIQAGQKIADAPEHMRINSDLQSGAAGYAPDDRGRLLGTDLGNGQSVESTLATDRNGQEITDPEVRRTTVEGKLDTLMSGNFNSVSDLRDLGFTDQEAEALMGLRDRGPGQELTTDEAVEFLFNRSHVAQQNSARDQVHKGAESLIKDVLFTASSQGAKIGQRTAKEAGRAYEEDRAAAGRDRGTQSRMSWLATEQLGLAGEMVLNKRDSTYKP